MADEALAVPNVLRSFTWREIDLVYVHSVWIGVGGSVSWQNIAVSPSLEFPESYHVVIELSCLVKPLFPLPTRLFLPIREGSGSHHDSELLGHSSLEGVYQDAVVIDSTASLGEFEGSGVLIKVSVELVHAEGINSLVGLILKVFGNEGFFKGFAYLLESLFRVGNGQVG